MQRVLLVEDNEVNRELIARRLKRRGFDVLLATDGAAGVESAAAHLPDLILMDIGLPILDGYEATRLIKENAATRHIPVIGLSAHAMSGDAERAMGAGCDDYDTKPVEWDRLLEKIEKLLAKAAEAAAARAAAGTAPAEESAAGPAARHLLLVDESSLRRDMIGARLTSLGVSFVAMADGRQALERFQKESFSALILDVAVKEIDGRPALERFRAEPKAEGMPIVISCSIDAVPDAIDCLDYGADEILPQPFRLQELRSRLDRLFELQESRRRLAPLEESLKKEQAKVEHLMQGLLPASWLEELRASKKLPPRRYDDTVVVDWDVPSLEKALDNADPAALTSLQQIIVSFEDLAKRYGMVTISRPGHDLLAVAGAFSGAGVPALAAARCVLEMSAIATRLGETVRFGLHEGPVLAGVVGFQHAQFGIWGNAVKWAARVRATSQHSVHASEKVWQLLEGRVQGEAVGRIPFEGGALPIYRIDRVD
jgi:CheY-like chemotaxis protein